MDRLSGKNVLREYRPTTCIGPVYDTPAHIPIMADDMDESWGTMDELEQDDGNKARESEEKWNVVVGFEGPGVKGLNPLKLTKIIKMVGEMQEFSMTAIY